MSQIVTITSFNGTYPFDVTICDYAYNQCYLAATGIISVPSIINIPYQLDGLLSVLVVITDSSGCEYFEQQTCIPIPEINPCSVIYQNNTVLYSNGYDITPSDLFPSFDVAHYWDPSSSTGYVWITSNVTKIIREWKLISLTPVTYDTTYNVVGYRDISYPAGVTSLSNGLCSKDFNVLVTINNTTRYVIIINLDLFPATTSNYYNTAIQIPPLNGITGDIIYTTNDKVLILLTQFPPPNKYYLNQYDISGGLEVEKLIGGGASPPTPNITNATGLYQENNLIYLVNKTGQTFNVDINYPYNITPFSTAGINPIEGASQIPNCLTKTLQVLTPQELSCLCLSFINNTNYDITVTYLRCDGVSIPQVCNSGTTIFVCGSNPQTNDTNIQIVSGLPCVNNTCNSNTTLIEPTPTPSVTITPTYTPTVTVTRTPTQTPVTPTPTVTNSQTPINVTPTVTKTNTPTVTVTPTSESSTTFRSIWYGSSVTLPYSSTGTYTGTIYWGDGSTSVNSYANRTHTYPSASTYTIIVDGTVTGFAFNGGGDKLKLREIKNWGTLRGSNNSNSGMFYGCSNLVLTGVSGTMNTSGITSFDKMFMSCSSITTVPNMGNWNTSSVTAMTWTFLNSSGFNENISGWTTTNVKNTKWMFNNAVSFNQPLDNWDVSNITNMYGMFAGAISFNQPLNSWVTSAVTEMYDLFQNNSSFNQDLSSWNTSNVISMDYMFFSALTFNQDLSSWDVSNVSGMTGMLSYTSVDTTNYDNTLVGWDSLPSLQNNVTVGAQGRTYTSAGAGGTARSNIISNYSWTFIGDTGV